MATINWQFAWKSDPMLKAVVITIEATIVGFVFAILIGLLLALARRSKPGCSQNPASSSLSLSAPRRSWLSHILVLRASPLWLPIAGFYGRVIGTGLHYGAYTSEVFRAGIDAITRGRVGSLDCPEFFT